MGSFRLSDLRRLRSTLPTPLWSGGFTLDQTGQAETTNLGGIGYRSGTVGGEFLSGTKPLACPNPDHPRRHRRVHKIGLFRIFMPAFWTFHKISASPEGLFNYPIGKPALIAQNYDPEMIGLADFLTGFSPNPRESQWPNVVTEALPKTPVRGTSI